MQKAFTYLILFCIILSSTEFHEVLRLPLLWEHFTEHKSENDSLSFLTFLEQHYAHSHSSESDDSEDHNLPFKSHDCNTVLKFSNKYKDVDPITSPTFGVFHHSTPLDLAQLPSGYSGAIWQPPQVC